MEKQEFINKIAPLVIAENNRTGKKLFPSVVIAQAICETGWGKSKMMMKANAIFGIKATASWKGKVYNSKTQECYDGVNYTEITASFRAYDCLADSIEDYFKLILGLARYQKALNRNTPLECIQGIKNGGYATSPLYVETIMTLIRQNNLTKYDVEDVENPVDLPRYIIGRTYTTQVALNVRTGAGTNYRIKKFLELTADGKKHAYNQTNAVLRPNTKVTCKDIIVDGEEIWLKIPSGFICAYYHGKIYIK